MSLFWAGVSNFQRSNTNFSARDRFEKFHQQIWYGFVSVQCFRQAFMYNCTYICVCVFNLYDYLSSEKIKVDYIVIYTTAGNAGPITTFIIIHFENGLSILCVCTCSKRLLRRFCSSYFLLSFAFISIHSFSTSYTIINWRNICRNYYWQRWNPYTQMCSHSNVVGINTFFLLSSFVSLFASIRI